MPLTELRGLDLQTGLFTYRQIKNDCFFVYLLSKVDVDSFVQILISMLYTRLYIEFLQFFIGRSWLLIDTWMKHGLELKENFVFVVNP